MKKEKIQPEANLQGEFYHWSKVIGLNCCLEYHTPIGRLDIAAFNSDWTKLIAIVECKRPDKGFDMVQIERYKRIGAPVYGLRRVFNAERLARQILRLHINAGVDVSTVQAIKKEAKPEIRPIYRRDRDKKGKVYSGENHPNKRTFIGPDGKLTHVVIEGAEAWRDILRRDDVTKAMRWVASGGRGIQIGKGKPISGVKEKAS